jgi:uncharacterized protein (TIGR02145 family)
MEEVFMNRKPACLSAAFCMGGISLFLSGISCTRENPLTASGNESVTDADGNVYRTVRIGNQVWTAENLRTTKYNDGTPIALDTSTTTWDNAATPKYCLHQNTTDPDSIRKYGTFYNWHVVNNGNSRKIAPKGWHVPSDAEWDSLENFLIAEGRNWDGTPAGDKIAKSLAAKTDWRADTTAGAIGCDLTRNNLSGFSALPASCRGNTGNFGPLGDFDYWWSATEADSAHAWGRDLWYNHAYLNRGSHYKSCGFSVRLVRD